MNMLLTPLPTEIDGLNIRSDFRVMVRFELLLQDPDLSDTEKLIKALQMFYIDPPQDYIKAMDGLLWFHRLGKDTEKGEGQGGKYIKPYDFGQDDAYIYAAFRSQYQLDLNAVKYLHWWQFRAMFMGLTAEQEIVKIMGYRTIDTTHASKAEKAHYKKLKAIYALKNTSALPKMTYEAYKQSMINYVDKRFKEIGQ